MAIADARALAPLFAPDGDARRLTRTSLVCVALIYADFAAAAFGLLPAWTLAIVVPLLVPRWMIAVHELFHLRSEREVDPLTRLQPLVFTPLSLGYRELLVNHRTHHRFMAAQGDAELYQIRGSPLAGLAAAMTAPEQMTIRWALEHGIDRDLAVGVALRAAIFAAAIAIGGTAFLWYLVPARLAFGASYFTFFYCLHRRGAAVGVYPLRLPATSARILTIVYGRDVVEATLHHDIHHASPRVAARNLSKARLAAGAVARGALS
jgi:fatty acid desaturase